MARGRIARAIEEQRRHHGEHGSGSVHTVWDCEIIGVVGPADSTVELDTEEEKKGIRAVVRTKNGTVLRIKLGSDQHEIFQRGTPAALVGAPCRIEYYGNSILDAKRTGLVYLEPDEEAQYPDWGADTVNYSVSALMGVMSDKTGVIESLANYSTNTGSDK